MTVVSPIRLANVFVELADTLIDEFDLIEFLQLLTTRVCELTAATATGLLLADEQQRLHFMAASDERMENLELFQVQADEGPCRDCFRNGSPVVNADLRHATGRWPRFAPRAVSSGFHSVHAFPLRLRQQTIGALGLFSGPVGRLAADDIGIVQALADVATISLLHERTVRRGEALTAQLQGALSSRILIEQAKGVLAQVLGVSVDEAFERLRSYCRVNHLPMRDVAKDIVTRSTTTIHIQRLSTKA
jgi:GAF domain-containing protein